MDSEIQLNQVHHEQQVRTEEAKRDKVPNVINHPEKIDAWLHDRQYDMLSPIVKNYADRKWLTIGDSGADAFSYRNRGVRSIVASSLSAVRLLSLKASGKLNDIEIKSLNAEDTGEPDNSYDIVVCKEAYHHFPRPAIAFYELLRVSKIAVAYNEPNCDNRFYLLNEVRTLVRKITRGVDRTEQQFESAGNFIFRLSVRESVKMATALQLPLVAHKHCSSFFVMSLADKNKTEKTAWWLLKLGIVSQWALSHLRLMSWGRVVLVVFKEMPEQHVLDDLKADGFKITHIPRNPYL